MLPPSCSTLLNPSSANSDAPSVTVLESIHNNESEIVDLKVKIDQLRRDNEGSDNYKWLQDALLSITDWGTDIFEALYKDEDVHIRNALAMNPSLPESILLELFNDEDTRVKLSVLSNSSCPKDILIKGSKDTENYASSRLRKAAALNPNTPKEIVKELEQKENSKILFSAINKLNHQQKTAYILKNVQGLSYKKISDIMNKSISSIESLIYRAKQNLKTIIKKI